MVDPNLEKLVLELRRGLITLAVLSQLDEEEYGYSLMQRLEGRGLLVEQGTLYPLLRRLEDQGLLESDWRVEEARPRRYYRISSQGRALLPALKAEWQAMVAMMESML
ncbi:MAG: helix-turn-helix transcriptional regulator [Anaerolineales bacterium]|nr:helix-turn-helix transcriptional regulator [Anaerolineales bacterium]